MAVYTQLGAEVLAGLIAEFDVGALRSAKGIAEGVSNSNWLIETSGKDEMGARFILTMYEKRLETSDLPFFLGLLDHLAERGCPVPRTIHDRQGNAYRFLDGKAVALIEFLPGVSVSEPTAAQARAVGGALAQVHLAAADFAGSRANGLGLTEWRALADACGHDGLASIDPALAGLVEREMAVLAREWPDNLPHSVIHADLFPDKALSAALLAGYEAVRPLSPEERAALPLLARGAAMRFLMTRAFDWMNTPEGAMVTRKDPMAFARRLQFYADPANARIFA
jgi:homoserine kinase type II